MALLDAKARRAVARPEVILPAYGCPDLVTASVYAGVRPRLVDTARGRWGYDLEALTAALSASTVAIVGVNLLGCGDQAPELYQIARQHGAALVQDSAQHLPREPAAWLGEYVVLSFGRGKPLNLLRGGALLHAPGTGATPVAMAPRTAAGARQSPAVRRLEALAFNIATHPRLYAVSRRLLGGSLGQTHYKPLEAIENATPSFVAEVASALAGYRDHPGYDARVWSAACDAWRAHGVDVLSCVSSAVPDPGGVRLRLPLLAPDPRTRDALVAALDHQGLGATAMYGQSMERLPGVPGEVAAQGPFPNATELAGRLLTLPTHAWVTPQAVQLGQRTVDAVLASACASVAGSDARTTHTTVQPARR